MVNSFEIRNRVHNRENVCFSVASIHNYIPIGHGLTCYYWGVGGRLKVWGLRREAAQQPIVVSHSGHRIFFKLQIGVPADQISQIKAVNPATNPSYLYTSLSQVLQWWIANHHSPTYEVTINVLDPKFGETTPVMNRQEYQTSL